MSVKTLLTAEDLWMMPEVPGKRFELVDGELVEMPGTGGVHNAVGGLVFSLLRSYVHTRNLGIVCMDGVGYVLRQDPGLVRIPDVSFIAHARIPADGIPIGFYPFAPDLAVEIVSPNDRPGEVRTKVGEYLAAGSRAVWVLWPERPAVSVHQGGEPTIELGPDDDLDGGDVLPGFRVRVRQLFEI